MKYLAVFTLRNAEFNEKNVCWNQNLAGKRVYVHSYLLYTKCHKVQSKEGVVLLPLIIAYEGGKKHTYNLGF